jgi:hypothetical protein
LTDGPRTPPQVERRLLGDALVLVSRPAPQATRWSGVALRLVPHLNAPPVLSLRPRHSPDDSLTTALGAATRPGGWWLALCLVPVVLSVSLPPVLAAGLTAIVVLFSLWLWLRQRPRRTVVAHYVLTPEQYDVIYAVREAARALRSVSGLWRVTGSEQLAWSHPRKVNAMASHLVSRKRTVAKLEGPRELVTAFPAVTLRQGRVRIYFLPDRIMIRSSGIKSVPWRAVKACAGVSQWIEGGRVPRDARQVDVTWQYANVGGGPDRRFKHNRQLPVLQFGRVQLEIADLAAWDLMCTQTAAAESFAAALNRAAATLG